jgi:hypothetical protein
MRFNPEKSLFELGVIRAIAAMTAGSAIFITITIALNSELSISLDFIGFNHAIIAFRFPLGILALGLSIIGICGANHRSEQTKRQIERTSLQIDLTRSQNNFANYYKHMEEFDKYCEKNRPENIEFSSTRALHRKIYRDSRLGTFSNSPRVDEHMREILARFINLTYHLCTKDVSDYREAIYNILTMRTELLKEFGLTQRAKRETSNVQSVDGVEYRLFDTSYEGIFQSFITLFETIDKILHFDADYETPEALGIITRIDLAGARLCRINLHIPEPLNFHQIFEDTASSYVKL